MITLANDDRFDDLSTQMFQRLRAMDAEATTILRDTGAPAGLASCGYHLPYATHGRTEIAWENGIRQTVYGSRGTSQSYPTCRAKKCDVVFDGWADRPIWMEIKGAWRDWWNGKGIYRSYLLYPLLSGVTKKTHSVPLDLRKLATLTEDDASYVAQLLVGFERPDDPMNADIAQLIELADLGSWGVYTDHWPSFLVPNQHVRCWLWYRAPGFVAR